MSGQRGHRLRYGSPDQIGRSRNSMGKSRARKQAQRWAARSGPVVIIRPADKKPEEGKD